MPNLTEMEEAAKLLKELSARASVMSAAWENRQVDGTQVMVAYRAMGIALRNWMAAYAAETVKKGAPQAES